MLIGPHWYIACDARRLGCSSPVGATVGGEHLALFRDRSGNPRALENRCLHRNAPVSMARVRDGGFVCAYHGWRYGFDGKLLEIPALPDRCPAPQAAIRAFPSVEQDGYVWVCLEAAPAHSSPMAFPNLGARGWTSFRMETRFRAGVEACLENFLDCPHAVFVHDRWFRRRSGKPVRAVVRTLADGAEAEFFDEPRQGSVVWQALFLKRGPMRHVDRFIAPNTSRVDYELPSGLHYIITSSCTPITETETMVHTVISFRLPCLGWLVRFYFEPLARAIIAQDKRMLDAVQKNTDRFGGPNHLSTRSDLLGHWIGEWRKALAARLAPPAAGMEDAVVVRL